MRAYDAIRGTFGAAALYAVTALGPQYAPTAGLEGTLGYAPRPSGGITSGAGHTTTRPAENWGSLSPQRVYGIREPIAMDYEQNRHRATNPTGYIGLGPFTPLSESEKFTEPPRFSGTGANYTAGMVLPGNFRNGYGVGAKAAGYCGKGGK